MNREIDKNKEFKGDFLYYIGLTGSLLMFGVACNYNTIVNTIFKENSNENVEPSPQIVIDDNTKESEEYKDKTVRPDGSSEKTPRNNNHAPIARGGNTVATK